MTDDWRHRAACRNRGPALWYSYDPDDQKTAAAICAACPVRTECHQHAETFPEIYGMWAGHFRRRNPVPPAHHQSAREARLLLEADDGIPESVFRLLTRIAAT